LPKRLIERISQVTLLCRSSNLSLFPNVSRRPEYIYFTRLQGYVLQSAIHEFENNPWNGQQLTTAGEEMFASGHDLHLRAVQCCRFGILTLEYFHDVLMKS